MSFLICAHSYFILNISDRCRQVHVIQGENNVRRQFLRFSKYELYLRLITQTEIEISLTVFHKLFTVYKHLQKAPSSTITAACKSCDQKEMFDREGAITFSKLKNNRNLV